MEIQKENEGEDFITCESCTKQCTDIENMQMDNGNNWFCPECWQELQYDFFFMDEPEENRES